jgi:hypothetical protein
VEQCSSRHSMLRPAMFAVSARQGARYVAMCCDWAGGCGAGGSCTWSSHGTTSAVTLGDTGDNSRAIHPTIGSLEWHVIMLS